MLQQQWRSITDATLQQCAERRIALIKENSQVKKNNFSKKIAQTGSRHTAEESADDSPVRKIIFSSEKGKTGSRYTAEESADDSPVRKIIFSSEKGKTGSRYIAKNLQKYLEPENTEKFGKKRKNQRKTNCHRLQFTDMHSAPSSRLRQCTPVSRETGIRTCHSGSQKSKGDTTVHKHTVGYTRSQRI
jgi:hypothetical protein